MAKRRSKKSYSMAAKKAWRTRKAKKRHGGKKRRNVRGLRRGIIGGYYRPNEFSFVYKGKHRKHKGKKVRGRRGNARYLPKLPMRKCPKCGRVIFGGNKGMNTHMRKHHRR